MAALEPGRVVTRAWIRPTVALAAAALAVAIGVALGNPTPGGAALPMLVLGLSAATYVLFRPHVGLLVITASSFILVVFAVTDDRYLNALDITIPLLLATGLLGRRRRDARAADRLETGPAHDAISRAQHRLSRSVRVYLGVAALSLVWMAVRIGPAEALDSSFILARGVEGVLVYQIALWWIRSERRAKQVYSAMLVGGVLFLAVNLYQLISLGTYRAGITWVVNHLDWPVEGPNEAGTTMVVLFAIVLAHHQVKPRFGNYIIFATVLLLLFLTQSRSGMLALLTFVLFNLKRVRLPYVVVGVLILALALVFVPPDFWRRVANSLSFKRGSFEVFSFMLRVYGYQIVLKVLQDHWLFGVGYLGFRFVSESYNPMRFVIGTAENFLLETAVGMGIIGVVVVVLAIARVFQLGTPVRHAAPPGTLGHEMARLHVPLMAGLCVANLTGDGFVGLISLSQLSLWCALMVRSGHMAARRAEAA